MATIDTLRIYDRLKNKTDLSESAAREIAEVFKDTAEDAYAELVKKEDLALAELRIIRWVAGMLVAQAAIVATLVKLL